MGMGENFVHGASVWESYVAHGLSPGEIGRGEPRPYGGWGIRNSESWMRESDARIFGVGGRICIVLEMRHLLGTMVEKAERLLLE